MFEYELNLINNKSVKRIAEDCVKLIPDYFRIIPASSTGKYHPKYALGEGGLYRHTKAVVVIALNLFNNDQFKFSQLYQDLIIASIIPHDGWKSGQVQSAYTVHMHPAVAVDVILNTVMAKDRKEAVYIRIICDNILSHMGQWNTSLKDSGVLPKPVTKMQKFVHLCDYLASRRDIEVVLEN